MTASHVWARSRRAGALLGAVAVLVAGCTAGGGNGARADRAGPARHSVATSPPRRAFAHPAATTPSSVKHSSGQRIARSRSPVLCAPPLGHPVTYRAGAASGLPVAVPTCLCCRWCACAWACCGCGPGRWPPRLHLTWLCCPRPLGSPGGDSSSIPSACWPGCRSFACPIGPRAPGLGPARSAAGSVQARAAGSARGNRLRRRQWPRSDSAPRRFRLPVTTAGL
jgi:hypothetical protein